MQYDEPPLTLGLDAAAIATLWGLAALLAATPIAYVAARAKLARRAAPVTEAVRRPTVARCAITTGLAVILAAFAGWLLLSAALTAPLAQADTAGNACDTGLQRDAIATNHARCQTGGRTWKLTLAGIADVAPDSVTARTWKRYAPGDRWA